MSTSLKPVLTSNQETLAVDIGGTGVKMMLLDGAGKPLSGASTRADSRACHAGCHSGAA